MTFLDGADHAVTIDPDSINRHGLPVARCTCGRIVDRYTGAWLHSDRPGAAR